MKTIRKTLTFLFVASLTLLSCSDDDDSNYTCNELPTKVVEVVNPTTGKIWMDRNLGASRAATSMTDELAYGDLYQWGRRADGHQCRNSNTITTLSSTAQPDHGDFIIETVENDYNWGDPQNFDLWQGVNGINNPCPTGFRLPTIAELKAELFSWSSEDSAGAFASPLKFTMSGTRSVSGRILNGTPGESKNNYWSSTLNNGKYPRQLAIAVNSESTRYGPATGTFNGNAIRCIKN